jgi:glycosyltransferase involved in cell wall biosynthesis
LLYPKLLTGESGRYYGQIKRAVESADGIIAVSENTRRDLAELLGVPTERVDVIYHAADERFRPLDDQAAKEFCQEHDLPESFILWVGILEPRKNLEVLLRALTILRDKEKELHHKLVVAGAKGWLYENTIKLVDELRLADDVIFFGTASVADLLLLYNGARLFVFPSLYEGFGLPPLEAMACGTPVVCSRTSSLPEVLGEAALYFDPLDAEALAEAIQRLAEDEGLRQELRQRGLEQAAKFSWQKTAEQTLAVYRRVYGQ